jgi:hypothetical protein
MSDARDKGGTGAHRDEPIRPHLNRKPPHLRVSREVPSLYDRANASIRITRPAPGTWVIRVAPYTTEMTHVPGGRVPRTVPGAPGRRALASGGHWHAGGYHLVINPCLPGAFTRHPHLRGFL